MLPLEQPDRIQIAFDDHRLVANAGLLLPVTLAQRLGRSQLVDRHVDLGRAPGRANTGDKMLTLVASALAGGDCIDDADALRAGGVGRVLGCVVKAPSTLGTFRRSFRWGHVRQLDRVSRELLAQAWATDAGPGDGPLTIDLDSTVCETFGLCKEGAQRHNYAGQRGYHPILAVAAGTGDVLMARLRQGRANTARGAGHFLRETVSRVRHAGATGQLTVRADSGFYAHAIVAVCRDAVCRDKDVRCSITVRQHESLRSQIDAIPEADWTPIPYWMEGAADVAETTYVPFESKPDAATPQPCGSSYAGSSPRPAPNWRCSPTTAITLSSPTGMEIPWRWRPTIAATPRSRTPSATSSTASGSTTSPRAASPPILSLPKGAWLAVQVIAHNLARWTTRIGLGEQLATTQTLRRRFFALPGRLTRSARRPPCICPRAGPGRTSSAALWRDCAPSHSLPDRA